MKNYYIILLAFLATFALQSHAIQISGTAINPALEFDQSTVSGGQLVLFVVDRNDNGFGSINSSDNLDQGSLLNGDDYILARGITTSFGATSGFTSFSSFSFTLGDSDIQGDDDFAVYFFDSTSSSASNATVGYYALATDATWTIPTNNAAVFNFSGTADADSFQQLSNVQTVNAVPEPSAFALIAGCFGLAWVMVRRRG